MTYKKLGIVKDIIIGCLNNKKSDCVTRKKTIEFVKEAIKTGKLQKNKLKEELIEDGKL